MNKFEYIKDSLEELGIDYSIDCSFIKVRSKYLIFDFYIKKPYKIIINYSQNSLEINNLTKNGFIILDFSKVDPSYDTIESTLKEFDYNNMNQISTTYL